MDVNSIKVGTVGKFHICKTTAWNPTTGEKKTIERDITGVIVMYRENYKDYFVIDDLGEQSGFKKEELVSVSSVRIGKELRDQFAIIAKRHEEIRKLTEEKEKIDRMLSDNRYKLKGELEDVAHIAGHYSRKEFDNMICEYGFRVAGSRVVGKSVRVMLQQSDNGTRYSKPDVSREFPFVYQEYDGACFLREEYAPKEYKAFLNRNAPSIKPALAKLADEVEQNAEVGDKYIYATTNYWVHLKDGFIKKDVDAIIKAMKG